MSLNLRTSNNDINLHNNDNIGTKKYGRGHKLQLNLTRGQIDGITIHITHSYYLFNSFNSFNLPIINKLVTYSSERIFG